MGWNDLCELEKKPFLDDGPYEFTVDSVSQPDDVSILVRYNIEGTTIVSRLFFDSEEGMKIINSLLVSVGIKDCASSFFPSEITNTIGKTGKCIVGHYTDISGYKKNKIRSFIYPWYDADLSWWTIQVIDQSGHICANCGSKSNLDAHHIWPKSSYPSKKYDLGNGQCLCRKCHKEWHEKHGLEAIGGPGL